MVSPDIFEKYDGQRMEEYLKAKRGLCAFCSWDINIIVRLFSSGTEKVRELT